MHTKDVEQWLQARPFKPFELQLTSGERISVRHPETCFLGRKSLHVVYARDRRIEGFSHVSLFHVVKIEPLEDTGDGQPHQDNGQNGET